MKKNHIVFLLLLFIPVLLSAQPFIDIVNVSAQRFESKYEDSLASPAEARNYNLNVCIPKVFKNGTTFLVRFAAENLASSIGDSHYSLYAFSMPVGFQFVSKNKKWKTMVLGIPKISSDLQDDLSKDMQYGGVALFTRVIHDSLKIKFGLYYNRECFGNFFVPLVGIDWKATKHINIYGLLPNNMRVEYDLGGGFYAGVGYKNYQRSYRLSGGFNNDFVRVRESQVKVFGECFVFKKVLVFTEIGYTLKYSFIQHDFTNVKEVHSDHPVYTPVKNNVIVTAGIAYRMRLD
jgi:hypothetical protein